MNKQTIQDVQARQRVLIQKIARYANELNDLDKKLQRMRAGKIKIPPPPGVKHKIEVHNPGITHDTFGDLIPSFGPK